MGRGWKIVIAIAAALAVLLAVNTLIVNQQTKPAKVTVEGGEILELPGGDVQVTNQEAQSSRPGAPIVLIHCYTCSLHWWDAMVPLLNEDHRVVRIDLLGHGGSEKPDGDYLIEEQAQLVAAALNQLGVQGAVVVGHSLGGAVATALAEESSQLVDRVVLMDKAPDDRYNELPLAARLARTPVLGQALWRIAPDFAVENGFESAFAPGFEFEDAFEDPDRVVDDYRAMTYTSYDRAPDEGEFSDANPLDERLQSALVPLLVIFGEEDQLVDAGPASEAYRDVPGARIALIEGAGHSPNVEKPQETARLILEFAADAGDEVLTPPRRVGLDRNAKARGDADGKRAGSEGGEKRARSKGDGRKRSEAGSKGEKRDRRSRRG